LPENEAVLVRRHYLEGERFDHVAKELGLSKSWASRLHTRAIKRLTEALRGQSR
jgi:RNA polymerase sigma factor for flagellar operon FliA